MSVVAKCIVETQYAPNADTTVYTCPAGVHTIIDKLTATNTDLSTRTFNVNLVPSGNGVGSANLIASITLVSGATYISDEIPNHVLNPGDMISVFASSPSVVVVRVSGREVT